MKYRLVTQVSLNHSSFIYSSHSNVKPIISIFVIERYQGSFVFNDWRGTFVIIQPGVYPKNIQRVLILLFYQSLLDICDWFTPGLLYQGNRTIVFITLITWNIAKFLMIVMVNKNRSRILRGWKTLEESTILTLYQYCACVRFVKIIT